MTTKKKANKTPELQEATFHDESMRLGHGGDSHPVLEDSKPVLTTQQGVPIADDQNSLKAGEHGPALLEDFILREKLFHFDHERIPERVVHARGYAAHGYFEAYDSFSHLTKAHLLQKKGQTTPAFVRFSTVAGNKGSVDLARDVRGFAVKLYTEEGNWDLVGNNIPVFFIQDSIKFPDLIHAAKDEPDRGFPQAQTAHDNFWDFVSLTPESMHMVMWIMSDRTLPRSFRFMEGFGVHTFRLINAEGQASFVKFHWKPKLGMQSVLWDEAVKINGADPDFHRRDLWNAIQAGDFPEWELGVQVFDEAFCERFEFDVLDATKLIPEEVVPVTMVGRLVLNRCVDNFFAETEQVAFCTQNIVPGIDFTNDPLLQGRNFSYLDTQLKRLGSPNFTQLPINAPKCPFAHFQQDGHMSIHNPKGRVNYSPNSWDTGAREHSEKGFKSHAEAMSGHKLRIRPERFADHYSQARQFYQSQQPIEQQHIQDALIFELSKVEKTAIRERMVAHLLNIDNELATAVADGLGLLALPKACSAAKPTIELADSPKLSILDNAQPIFKGRKVGILLADHADATLFHALTNAIQAEGASFTLIAPKIGGVTLSDGTKQAANETIGGAPSVLFDAIAVLLAPEEVPLISHLKVHEFITDAYFHYKFVAYAAKSAALIEKNELISSLDNGFTLLDNADAAEAFVKQCRATRFWARKPGL